MEWASCPFFVSAILRNGGRRRYMRNEELTELLAPVVARPRTGMPRRRIQPVAWQQSGARVHRCAGSAGDGRRLRGGQPPGVGDARRATIRSRALHAGSVVAGPGPAAVYAGAFRAFRRPGGEDRSESADRRTAAVSGADPAPWKASTIVLEQDGVPVRIAHAQHPQGEAGAGSGSDKTGKANKGRKAGEVSQ